MSDLYLKRSGSGFPVLLLHGYMESCSMWDGLFEEQIGMEWLAIDLPGHGQSTLETAAPEPTIEYFSRCILDVLRHENIDNFHVVGHSMGGYIALNLKELHPGCQKVVLLNSNAWEDPPQKKLDRLRVADIAYKAKDLFIHQAIPALFFQPSKYQQRISTLIEEARQMTSDGIAFAALAMRTREDKTALVNESSGDFLILQGAHDPLISLETMDNWSSVNNIPFQVLEHSGHMSHIEEPQVVRQKVQDFLLNGHQNN